MAAVKRLWSTGTNYRSFIVATAFAMMGYVGGSWYYAEHGDYARFYQGLYGPAVALAAGYGYVNPSTENWPELRAFLRQESASLNLDTAPETLSTKDFAALQTRWTYLFFCAATAWSISGEISWSGLRPLFGVLFALTLVISFVLFRQLLPWAIACLGTVLVALSPTYLYFLPQFRDFSKVPFTLGVLAL